ncbi:MAG: alpha/beta hydrolase [Leptospiraceae bacterium]|nr:alpha/beta hydrolase [Leptospiraceae bacterium]MCB1317169.1 alpha/beta hydrolase [Leptospiraceae bacterium]MCB1321463.1 alpha/beta hydrolase [Leptospiraceae bacterium]
MRQSVRILFIPGLGADRRMYAPLMAHLHSAGLKFQAVHLQYVSMRHRREPLEAYARRIFTEQKPGRRFDLIIGCSLGGMIAQSAIEQKLVHTDRLVLISTTHSHADLTRLSQILGRVLYHTPGSLSTGILRLLVRIYPLLRRSVSQAAEMARMAAESPPGFLFQGTYLALNWRSITRNADKLRSIIKSGLAPDTFRVHGTSDPLIGWKKVIRLPLPGLVFDGGNHIIVVTRADTIARAIVYRYGWF